jgi:hypothetical protein
MIAKTIAQISPIDAAPNPTLTNLTARCVYPDT